MKKLFFMTMMFTLSINAFSSSETKRELKMTEEGDVSQALLLFGANATLTAMTVSSPFFGFWVYLCVTQRGPGLNADLDFLTYDEKYGLLQNLSSSLEYVVNSEYGEISTETSKKIFEGISSSAQKTAKLILSESDTFYADSEVSPERTPELYKTASEVSNITGEDINEAAENVILTIEQNIDYI